MNDINFSGMIAGAATFIIIAFARYITIKAEYHFSKKFWMVFLFTGLTAVSIALFLKQLLLSTIISVFGFTFLWGIGEIIEQEKRVEKGWFPENPKRKYKQKKKDV